MVVRHGALKLIEFYEDMRVELYDLRHEPSEKEDLGGKLPGTADRLQKLPHDWRRQVNAAMPERAGA